MANVVIIDDCHSCSEWGPADSWGCGTRCLAETITGRFVPSFDSGKREVTPIPDWCPRLSKCAAQSQQSGAMQYEVIQRETRAELVESVRAWVNMGWSVQGGVQRKPRGVPKGEWFWAQALTRAPERAVYDRYSG